MLYVGSFAFRGLSTGVPEWILTLPGELNFR
jgi:hypothetical protein